MSLDSWILLGYDLCLCFILCQCRLDSYFLVGLLCPCLTENEILSFVCVVEVDTLVCLKGERRRLLSVSGWRRVNCSVLLVVRLLFPGGDGLCLCRQCSLWLSLVPCSVLFVVSACWCPRLMETRLCLHIRGLIWLLRCRWQQVFPFACPRL